ncbi:hypothetical protein V6N13_065561 [Hibiscus sabdariffa]
MQTTEVRFAKLREKTIDGLGRCEGQTIRVKMKRVVDNDEVQMAAASDRDTIGLLGVYSKWDCPGGPLELGLKFGKIKLEK